MAFKPNETWIVTWSLVKLGHVDEELLYYSAQHVLRNVANFPPEELSKVLWMAGKVG